MGQRIWTPAFAGVTLNGVVDVWSNPQRTVTSLGPSFRRTPESRFLVLE
jgi:hypothetical protein